MGEVYRARDTRLNRTIAIKVLAADVGDAVARRRFQGSSDGVVAEPPHIITAFEAGEWDGRQYLATEFVDSGTLEDWGRAEKRSWRTESLLRSLSSFRSIPVETPDGERVNGVSMLSGRSFRISFDSLLQILATRQASSD